MGPLRGEGQGFGLLGCVLEGYHGSLSSSYFLRSLAHDISDLYLSLAPTMMSWRVESKNGGRSKKIGKGWWISSWATSALGMSTG